MPQPPRTDIEARLSVAVAMLDRAVDEVRRIIAEIADPTQSPPPHGIHDEEKP